MREIEEEASSISTRINSHWLHEGELRMDAEYYSDSVMRVRQLLREWKLGTALLGSLTSSVAYPTRFKRIYARDKHHGVPFLTASKMLHFRPASEMYLARRRNQLENCTVPQGWLLITRSGSVGRCVLVGERLSKFAITDDAIRVEPSSEMPIGYLYAFLMSWIGQTLLTKDQYGSAIKHLESHHVANTTIPVLPEAEMIEIAERIELAYALRERANALLDNAMENLHCELGLPAFDESLVQYLSPQEKTSHPQSDPIKLRAFTLQASSLLKRLDASYHVPVVSSVISTLKGSRYGLTKLGVMADNVTIPPRFKRIYVSAQYGVPFILGWTPQLGQRRGQVKRDSRWKV